MYSRSDIWKLFHADQTTKTSLTDQSGHFSTRTVAHGVFLVLLRSVSISKHMLRIKGSNAEWSQWSFLKFETSIFFALLLLHLK